MWPPENRKFHLLYFQHILNLIEGHPSPPDHEDPDDGVGGAAHGGLLLVVPPPEPRPQHLGGHEGPRAAHQVDLNIFHTIHSNNFQINPATARQVHHAHRPQPALLGPQPPCGQTKYKRVEK